MYHQSISHVPSIDLSCTINRSVMYHQSICHVPSIDLSCTINRSVMYHQSICHVPSIDLSCTICSVVTIPDFAMRYVSRYLCHDAIRIAILVSRVSQSLDLQFVYDGSAIYRPRYTLPNHHNRCRMCRSLAVA